MNAADNLDNMLEHIFVLRDMKERFGFPIDPTHVQHDISVHIEWPVDRFSRQCLALCNAALVHFHFPQLSSEMSIVLGKEGLREAAGSLNQFLQKSVVSKPQMIAALTAAVGINASEVELRSRNVIKKCDNSAPLIEWLKEDCDPKTLERPTDC